MKFSRKIIYYIKFNNQGQSLLEIVIAMGIFVLIASALATLSLGGFSALRQSGETIKAQALLIEGTEAVRAIRNRAWNEIIYSNTTINSSTGQWRFTGESPSEQIGLYTRKISFNNVCRNSSQQITDCPGNYTDLQTKLVSSTVSWISRGSHLNTVEQVFYLTNWDSSNWEQTDWSGGGGQDLWSNQTQFSSSTNIDYSTTGELKLALAQTGSWINAGGTLIEDTSDSDFDSGVYSSTTRSGSGNDASLILSQTRQWAEHGSSGIISKNLNDLALISSSSGWAVADSGKILNYDGNNWTETIDLGSANVNAIDIVSEGDIWSAGKNGKIWHYNGSSWSEDSDTGKETWNDIDMLNASLGFVVANGGHIAQYNGFTWLESVVPNKANIYSVATISTSSVWGAGASGRFWYYNGSNWSLYTDTGEEKWYDLGVVSSTAIWAVGNGGAIAYYNGSTWDDSISSPTNQNLNSIYIISESDIWATGENGVIIHYNGSVWSLYTDTGNEDWNAIAMLSGNSGFVVGDSGKIFAYDIVYNSSGIFTSDVIDGGSGINNWNSLSWTEIIPSGGDITVSTRSGNTLIPDGSWSGWSSEMSNSLGEDISSPQARYLQYRLTFSRPLNPIETPQLDDITIVYNSPTGEHLRGIDAVATSNIWAVGNHGVIIHYDGSSWSEVSSPINNDLYGIDMISASVGWAVGRSGKILYYDGSSWSEQTDTGGEPWNAVSMSSSTKGFAVGNGSHNIAEYNGSTWTKFFGPVSQGINDIYMLNTGVGWAVGDSGKILYYDGSAWSEQADMGSQNIRSIFMNSVSDGWATGDSGKIWHYNGSSWSEYSDTGKDSWQTVAASSLNTAWLGGDANELLHWNGVSWSSQNIPTNQTIYSLAPISDINAWAVGRNGTIIHFSQDSVYQVSGFITSSAFNLSDNSPVQIINWDEDKTACPSVCDIKLQVRTASDLGGLPGVWSNWYGYSGSGSYFTDYLGSLISTDLNNARWVQYRAWLSGDGLHTPILQSVRINYK